MNKRIFYYDEIRCFAILFVILEIHFTPPKIQKDVITTINKDTKDFDIGIISIKDLVIVFD